jgi:hypothetical protein
MREFGLLFGVPAWIIAVVIFAVCFLVAEGGYRLGKRHAIVRAESTGDAEGAARSRYKKDHLGAAQAAVAALLGLLLAFTVSMSVDRFESRKLAVIDEANAIGTAYLRTDLLPEPQRTQSVAAFAEYVDIRLQLASPERYLSEASGLQQKAAELQQQLWSLGVSVSELDIRATTYSIYLEALNEMIDSAARREAGLRNHVPEPVIYLIFVVAFSMLGIMGYASGVSGGRSFVAEVVVALVVAAVIFIILDFDRPFRGLVTVNQQSIEQVRDLIARGLLLR